jgi:membrane associated rhomboid family serine protease
MLIIPIENKPQWSRPPLITLGLILLNLLVFVIYQGKDEQRQQLTLDTYLNFQLLAEEEPLFWQYLDDEQLAQDMRADLDQLSEPQQRAQMLGATILSDREFDQFLRAHWASLQAGTAENWREEREQVEAQRNRISIYAGGMTPAEARPLTFVTNLFLHGGWDHLIGNMVFLFLFGFALESVLRAHLYLGFYLLAGIAANLVHLSLNLDDMTPVVGASGAISGLMGMYLALYRLRKIRFFYTLLFYFGEFRAPALMILPLWLGNEIYGHFFIDSNTAYSAHAGGLVAGALLMLLAKRTQTEFSAVQESIQRNAELNELLKSIDRAMANLDASKAQLLIRRACNNYPLDPRPWRAAVDLTKSQPHSKAFHESCFALLKQFVAKETPFAAWRLAVRELLAEYAQISPQTPALTGPLSLALAVKFAQHNDKTTARIWAQRAQQLGVSHPQLKTLLAP